MTDLKPCPFCGGRANFRTTSISHCGHTVGYKFIIGCTRCGTNIADCEGEVEIAFRDGELVVKTDDREKCIEVWNRRIV